MGSVGRTGRVLIDLEEDPGRTAAQLLLRAAELENAAELEAESS